MTKVMESQSVLGSAGGSDSRAAPQTAENAGRLGAWIATAQNGQQSEGQGILTARSLNGETSTPEFPNRETDVTIVEETDIFFEVNRGRSAFSGRSARPAARSPRRKDQIRCMTDLIPTTLRRILGAF
jgi:hypothetical protein